MIAVSLGRATNCFWTIWPSSRSLCSSYQPASETCWRRWFGRTASSIPTSASCPTTWSLIRLWVTPHLCRRGFSLHKTTAKASTNDASSSAVFFCLLRESCGPLKVHWSTPSTREKVLWHMRRSSESGGVDPTCCCWGTLWGTWPWPTECPSTGTSSPSASSMIRLRPAAASLPSSGFGRLTRHCLRQVENREKAYLNAFDVVLVKDETMDVPNAILRYITSSRDDNWDAQRGKRTLFFVFRGECLPLSRHVEDVVVSVFCPNGSRWFRPGTEKFALCIKLKNHYLIKFYFSGEKIELVSAIYCRHRNVSLQTNQHTSDMPKPLNRSTHTHATFFFLH